MLDLLFKKVYYKFLTKLTKSHKYAICAEKAKQKWKFLTTKRSTDTIYVIGDSHTDLFCKNHFSSKKNIGGVEHFWFLNGNYKYAPFIITYHLDAVLAYTSSSAKSSLRTREKIEYLINQGLLPSGAILVTSFGEIDCRVHALRQTELQGISVEQAVENIAQNYLKFLLWLKAQGYRIIVYGPPAQQKDNAPFDPNYPRYGSESERNYIVELFNHKLKELAHTHKFGFVSLFEATLLSKGKTNPEYFRDGVHLSNKAYDMLIASLKQAVDLLKRTA